MRYKYVFNLLGLVVAAGASSTALAQDRSIFGFPEPTPQQLYMQSLMKPFTIEANSATNPELIPRSITMESTLTQIYAAGKRLGLSDEDGAIISRASRGTKEGMRSYDLSVIKPVMDSYKLLCDSLDRQSKTKAALIEMSAKIPQEEEERAQQYWTEVYKQLSKTGQSLYDQQEATIYYEVNVGHSSFDQAGFGAAQPEIAMKWISYACSNYRKASFKEREKYYDPSSRYIAIEGPSK